LKNFKEVLILILKYWVN